VKKVGYQRFREIFGVEVPQLSTQIHLGGNGVPRHLLAWYGIWYAIKIEQKFKQKKRDFGSTNQEKAKGSPKPQNKGQIQGMVVQDNLKKPQDKENTMKPKKGTRKWCEFQKSSTHNTSECRAK
jgi:hypothetical protein